MDIDRTEEEIKMAQALDELIRQAVRKIGGKKENDICRYLPVETGGYMHHFTMRKMKTEDPETLSSMIKKYIVNASKPQSVVPKPRAARGSRKRREGLNFSRNELEKLLVMAKRIGDHDMVNKLSPKRSLAAYKRDLIASIRRNEVNHSLWRDYVDALEAVKNEGDDSRETANVVSSSFNSNNW